VTTREHGRGDSERLTGRGSHACGVGAVASSARDGAPQRELRGASMPGALAGENTLARGGGLVEDGDQA
jgi:hypothetical protein